MSLRSHLFFERDNANLAREKSMQNQQFNRHIFISLKIVSYWYEGHVHDIFFPLINGFFAVLKSFENIPSILEMLGNLRVIRKSLLKNWESSEVFGLVNSWAVWPLTTIFGVPGCFEGVPGYYGMFRGCSRVVPGCSGVFRGCSGGFRGCSGAFRGVPGFTDTPEKGD